MEERVDETAPHSATRWYSSHDSGPPKNVDKRGAILWGIEEDTILTFVYSTALFLFFVGLAYFQHRQAYRRERHEAEQKLTEARTWPLQARSNFLDPEAHWPVNKSDGPLAKINRSISIGRYRWQVETHKSAILWARGPWVDSDFLAEVKIRRIGGSPDVMAGLVFGERRADDFFSALLAQDQLFFRAEERLETREIADEVPGLSPDLDRQMTIVVQQGISRFYLDGKYVGQAEVSPHIRGTVGLMVSIPNQQKAHLEFVDFQVRALPVPPLQAIEGWPLKFWDSFSFSSQFWASGKWPVGGFQKTNVEGSRNLSGGKYLWRVNASRGPGLSRTIPDLMIFRDFMASVDTHLIEGSKGAAVSLAMWCPEQKEAHLLQLTAEGKMRLGLLTEPGNASYHGWRKTTAFGRDSNLSLVVIDGLATFFVNQVYAGHVSHNCTPPYRVVMLLELMEQGDNAFYALDNFQVREPKELQPL